MPETRFEALRLELLKGGVAPFYVERTLIELEEHCTDLENAALAAGLDRHEAARRARESLGDEAAIVAAVLSKPELLAFSVRYPRISLYLHSAAEIGMWPGRPLLYCIEHRPDLARWGAAISVAAALVGGVLATLNWLIVLV